MVCLAFLATALMKLATAVVNVLVLIASYTISSINGSEFFM